jgi:hypothetical protein
MPLSRRRLHPALALLAATVCLALLWASGELAARRAGDDVRAAARHRLEVYSTSLSAVLEKYSYLPYTVAQNPDLQQLIAHPDDAQARARVNDYLARVNREAGALVLYAMGADGTTQGSSNWDTPESYVGMNFGFRPYVLDAMQGRTGGFYGVGVTTHVAGYFISAPVRDGQGRPIGVVAVKVSLAEMENSWRRASDRVLVVDRNGIAFWPRSRSGARTPSRLEPLRTGLCGGHPPVPGLGLPAAGLARAPARRGCGASGAAGQPVALCGLPGGRARRLGPGLAADAVRRRHPHPAGQPGGPPGHLPAAADPGGHRPGAAAAPAPHPRAAGRPNARWPRPTASWRTRSKRAPPTCARPTRPWPRR